MLLPVAEVLIGKLAPAETSALNINNGYLIIGRVITRNMYLLSLYLFLFSDNVFCIINMYIIMNELSIGSKIELSFITLEVVEEDIDCEECFFSKICSSYDYVEFGKKIVGECMADKRVDGKNVFFKVIERKL